MQNTNPEAHSKKNNVLLYVFIGLGVSFIFVAIMVVLVIAIISGAIYSSSKNTQNNCKKEPRSFEVKDSKDLIVKYTSTEKFCLYPNANNNRVHLVENQNKMFSSPETVLMTITKLDYPENTQKNWNLLKQKLSEENKDFGNLYTVKPSSVPTLSKRLADNIPENRSIRQPDCGFNPYSFKSKEEQNISLEFCYYFALEDGIYTIIINDPNSEALKNVEIDLK